MEAAAAVAAAADALKDMSAATLVVLAVAASPAVLRSSLVSAPTKRTCRRDRDDEQGGNEKTVS
jgi:hypothetical protein